MQLPGLRAQPVGELARRPRDLGQLGERHLGADGGVDQVAQRRPQVADGVAADRALLRRSSATGHAGLAQQRAADDHPLHLAGALVEPEEPGVAVEPLDRRRPQVAQAAVHLHGPVDGAADHLGAEQLRRRRPDRGVLAAVVARRRPRAPCCGRPAARRACRRASPGPAGTGRSARRPAWRWRRRRPTRRAPAAPCRRTAPRCAAGRGRARSAPSRSRAPPRRSARRPARGRRRRRPRRSRRRTGPSSCPWGRRSRPASSSRRRSSRCRGRRVSAGSLRAKTTKRSAIGALVM